MSASKIELRDCVATLRLILPYVHPAGQATIDTWLAAMTAAATVARPAKHVTGKVALERQWERESAETDPTAARL